MSREFLSVAIKREEGSEDLPLPSYQTAGAAGMDVCSAVDCVVEVGQTVLIPTGFSIAVPSGFEAQLRPRSGLALKHGITLLNTPGTIDCDYRGEIKVIVTNFGTQSFSIRRGDRIAQMVIAAFERVEWRKVEELPATERGDGGFGHSGV